VTQGGKVVSGFCGRDLACPVDQQVIRSRVTVLVQGAKRFSPSTRKHMAALAMAMNLPGNVTTCKTCNRNCIVQEWNKLIRLNGVFGCHDSGKKTHRRQAAFFITTFLLLPTWTRAFCTFFALCLVV